MLNLLKRFLTHKTLAVQIGLASLVLNLLGLASSLYVIQVFNRYVGHGIDSTLYTLSTGMLLAMGMEFCFRWVRQRLATATAIHPERHMVNQTFAILTQAKVAALEAMPAGMRQEVLQGLNAIQSAYAPTNILIVVDLPFALIFLLAVYLIHPILGLAALVVLVFSVIITILGAKRMQQVNRAIIQAQAGQWVIAASAGNMDTVRAFNGAPLLLDRWHKHSANLRTLRHTAAHKLSHIQSLMTSLNGFMTLCIIGIGASLAATGTLDVGTLIGANILAARALMIVSRFAQLSGSLAQAKQSSALLEQFSKLPLEPELGTKLPDFSGSLEFRDMAFQYSNASTPLFESVSFRLETSNALVVTGNNGSGKTTFARLLTGLIEPTRGSILIDGVDLRQINLHWWRKQLIYLPQEPAFLHATLRENISLLNPKITDETIVAILRNVGLGRFLDESSQGLERVITQGGQQLSLGVRRRLALARAMVTDGILVILDEPSEGFDAEGLAMISKLASELDKDGKTIIVLSSHTGVLKADGQVLDLNVKPVPKRFKVEKAHG